MRTANKVFGIALGLLVSTAIAQQRPGVIVSDQVPHHGARTPEDVAAPSDSDLQKLLQAQTAMLESLNRRLETLQLRVAALEATADAKGKR